MPATTHTPALPRTLLQGFPPVHAAMPRPHPRSARDLIRHTLAATAILTAAACASSGQRSRPAAMADYLLVLNKGAATAALMDPATGATLATMPTGNGPHEVAVSPDGRTAVVTNYGTNEAPGSTLTVLDLTTRSAAATIELAPYSRPHGVAWLPDGQLVAVTLEADSLVALVDVANRRLDGTVRTGQRTSHLLRVSNDGAYAYVANIGSGSVTMIDLVGRYVLRTTPTGAGAEGLALTPDGAELWVANRSANTVTVLDAQTLAPRDTLQSADFPIRVAFTPDGETALVTNARSGELRFFDVRTGLPDGLIAMRVDSGQGRGTMLGMEFGVGTGVPIGMVVTPDSRTAYVANANADLITVVDVRERRISGYLPTGREPDGMALVPVTPRQPTGDDEPPHD